MRATSRCISLAGTLLLLSGCLSTQVRNEVDEHETKATEAVSRPALQQREIVVSSTDRLYIPVRRIKVDGRRSPWLTGKVVNIDLDSPVPLNTALQPIVQHGVNVVSDLPLDSYTWSGKVSYADVETALRMILGGVGLDYDVDDDRRLVTIRPVRSKTWTLNLGNRSTRFSSGGANSVGLSDNDTSVTSAGSGTNGASSGSANSNARSSGIDGAANGTKITTEDNFWKSLGMELDSRLQVRLPVAAGRGGWSASAATQDQQGGPAQQSQAGSADQKQTSWVGSYALNPETGAITVSAPHWILQDLDAYMSRVQTLYNAEITFNGELLMVTHNRSDSEGLDISSFARFAGDRYGAVIQNNALGGVTVTMPTSTDLSNVSAASQSVGGALIGVKSSADALQIFNAWLSEVGRVSILQRPIVTTTSGVPGEFSKRDPRYFNLVSQETSSTSGNGAVSATRNTLQSKTFGTLLTINPRYDYDSGKVRAQIALNQVLPNGSQTINQTITSGDTFETISTAIPLGTEMAYNGEALLADGDVVLVGGHTEERRELTENGLPGKRGAISGIFGSKSVSREYVTYYFALRVSIKVR